MQHILQIMNQLSLAKMITKMEEAMEMEAVETEEVETREMGETALEMEEVEEMEEEVIDIIFL